MTGDEIEMWLKGYPCEYEFRQEIPLNDIRIPRSGTAADGEAQNRETDQPTAVVEMYAAAYRRGDVMPPLILYAGVDGRLLPYQLIDGFTRTRALRSAGEKRCEAFVVTCSEETMRRMVLTCNARHGTRPPDLWLFESAMALVDSGLSIAAASTLANLPSNRLSEFRTRRDAGRRAERFGVLAPYNRLAPRSKTRIAGVGDDQVFTELLKLSEASGGMSESVISAHVEALKDIGSEAERLAYIAEHRSALAAEPPKPSESLNIKLKKRLQAVLDIDVDATWTSSTTTERREIRDLAESVCEHLRKRFK